MCCAHPVPIPIPMLPAASASSLVLPGAQRLPSMPGFVSSSPGCPGAGHGSPCLASVSPPLFPACVGTGAWMRGMWCDGGGWYLRRSPSLSPWPHPGVCGWQGIAMAEPHHGSGAGKPSPWPSCDVWLRHPLPCGAFPLPGVSQTLARPLLWDGAGAGGMPARAEPSQGHRCHLCSLKEDPRWTPLPAQHGGDGLELPGQVSVLPEPC